jgi:hypothetical protein
VRFQELSDIISQSPGLLVSAHLPKLDAMFDRLAIAEEGGLFPY